jgi:hypothetical protein
LSVATAAFAHRNKYSSVYYVSKGYNYLLSAEIYFASAGDGYYYMALGSMQNADISLRFNNPFICLHDT